jgi:hypothetical protein
MQARPRAGRVAVLVAVLAALLAVGGMVTGAGAALADALTVVCPDVASRVSDVPDAAEAEVDRELANLQQQIAEVEARLEQEPDQADSQLGVLKERRVSTIDRIVIAITRAGGQEPAGIRSLAECRLREGGDDGGGGGGGAPDPAPTGGGGGGGADRPATPPERPTPSPSPTPDPPTCRELAHQVAGTEDDAQAGLILRLAGQDALAECVDPGAAAGLPPGRGPGAGGDRSGNGGAGAGAAATAPSWSRSVVTFNAQGLGLDPVIGTSILLLLLAGLTFLLIRADIVQLTRAWGGEQGPDETV